MTRDCIEKSLKAAMIAEGRLPSQDLKNHDKLNDYVKYLSTKHSKFHCLEKAVRVIGPYYNETRWPNRVGVDTIPRDKFFV